MVEKVTNEILCTNIKMSLTLILIGLVDQPTISLSANRQALLFYLILLARREICKKWIDPAPPHGLDWLQAVKIISKMDIIEGGPRSKIWDDFLNWNGIVRT